MAIFFQIWSHWDRAHQHCQNHEEWCYGALRDFRIWQQKMKNDSKADLKTWNLNQILLVKAFSRYIVHTTEEISIVYLAAQVHLWSSSSSWELSTLILPMLVKALFNLQRCRHGLYYLQYLHHYIIIFLKTTSLMLNYILHRIGLYISTARNTSMKIKQLFQYVYFLSLTAKVKLIFYCRLSASYLCFELLELFFFFFLVKNRKRSKMNF